MGEPTTSTRAARAASEDARWAWEQIERASGFEARARDEYAVLVRRLPARLLTNGLGQTLAFLYSRAKPGKRGSTSGAGRLLEQLEGFLFPPASGQCQADAMQRVTSMSLAEYRGASRRLLAVAQWLKRFADGMFPDTGEDHRAE